MVKTLKECPACGTTLLMKSNQKCCGGACRQKAMNMRVAAGAAAANAAAAAATAALAEAQEAAVQVAARLAVEQAQAAAVQANLQNQVNVATAAAAAAQVEATAHQAAAAAALAEAQAAQDPNSPLQSKRARVRFTSESDAIHYNELYHEHKPGPALCTIAGQLDMEQLKLLLPFLNVMGLARAADGTVLGRDGVVLKNLHGFRMCGFDSYPKVHGFEQMGRVEQVQLQRHGTLGFDSSRSKTHHDGWGSWAASFPMYLLPAQYAHHDSSASWAADLERMLLQTLTNYLPKMGCSLDPRIRLSHAHVLDQEKLGSSFKWHRDNEEQHPGRQIEWTMVVLLRFDAKGEASSMMIAGASAASPYKKVGAFHLFDSALYHSTVESPHGGVKVGLFFARPW